MDLLLMGAMMALMLVFFQGRGHHKSPSAPNHHTTNPGEATVPSPETSGLPSQSGELRREPNPDPKAPGESEPAPPAPKAE